jgi:hypothetical protein
VRAVRVVTNAGLVLASLVLVFLAVETALRLFGADTPTSHPLGAYHRFDPEIGWTGAPDVDRTFRIHFRERTLPGTVRVRHNRDGLRGAEVPVARTPGRARVVVLGDSYLWGWGVEDDETFSARLARLTGAEVVTLACSSYGTIQEMLLFETAGAAYRPDVVILGFHMNDLEDNVDSYGERRPFGAMDGGELALRNHPVRRRIEGPLRVWLYDRSRAALFLGDRWQRFVATIDGAAGSGEPRPYVPRSLFRDDPDFDRAWEVTRAALERLDRSIRGAGAEMVILAVPHPIQVLDERRALDLAQLGRSEADVDLDRTIERLRAFAAERGARFLDLRPALRGGREPYNERPEFHWTPAGHDAAARAASALLSARPRT